MVLFRFRRHFKVAQTADVKFVPTGLFCRDKIMSPDWAGLLENDRRIAKLRGLPFSENYPQNILQQPTNFNSFALVQALTAVQTTEPAREPEACVLFKDTLRKGLDTAKWMYWQMFCIKSGINKRLGF